MVKNPTTSAFSEAKLEMLAILARYKAEIDAALLKAMEEFGPETPLRKGCEYALLTSGKRFRPAIVLMVAHALHPEEKESRRALLEVGMAVEYTHVASLIADDLPCMDDDALRRDCPTLHKAHGEAVAVLVTYALLASGYEKVHRAADLLAESGLVSKEEAAVIARKAVQNVSYNSGIFGAVGGQYLDLYSSSNCPPELFWEIVDKKTSAIFEISFILGWLYGRGSLAQLNRVKQLAAHFGRAFQLADDLVDIEQDASGGLNAVTLFGKERTIQLRDQELAAYQAILTELGLDKSDLSLLGYSLK
jgi:geranylgeranyl diphosphate synthase type II